MAYTSDLRLKNLIKEIHLEILKELDNRGIKEKPVLRIFDESREDAIDWEKGGLTFQDKKLSLNLGSNDAGWFLEKSGKYLPIVVVEGTFGPERGQFGDGQINRFSHPLGPAKTGTIGVLFSPYKGESFVKTKERNENISFKIQYAHLRKDIVRAALNVNNVESGKYLVIDIYNPPLLKELVIETFLKMLGKENKCEQICSKIISKMKNYIADTTRSSNSQLLKKVFSEDNKLLKGYTGRIFTHNIEALTTSQKRDGHGLLGKNLIESYLISEGKVLCIFIRLNQKDIENLKKRKAKEFTYLLNCPNFKVVCSEDLIFKNKSDKLELLRLQTENLHMNAQKEFIKKLKNSFENGDILIKF